jgi:hypothetical protein
MRQLISAEFWRGNPTSYLSNGAAELTIDVFCPSQLTKLYPHGVNNFPVVGTAVLL